MANYAKVCRFVALLLAGTALLASLGFLTACGPSAATNAASQSAAAGTALSVADKGSANTSAASSVSAGDGNSAANAADDNGASSEAANANVGEGAVSKASVPEVIANACAAVGVDVADLSCGQLIVVSSSGGTADISFYERTDDGSYVADGAPAASEGYVGSEGVGVASESSCRTPAGLFGIPFAFGVSANPGTAMEYHQTTGNSYWVDDPSSDLYNTWVETTRGWNSAEYLDESPSAYAYGFVIGYNNPGYLEPQGAISGAGSAMFFHCNIWQPTWGCVTVPSDKMVEVLQWLDPVKNPQILIA